MSNSPAIPKVSIILPTYNRLGFLEEAIRSITSQELEDWELIVVDDGSTDGTGDYLAELLKSLVQPWQYIYQNNQGAYAARNRGLDESRGAYVAFYDSDDSWLPHHLRDCVEAMERYKDVDWVYGASRIVDLSTKQILSENCFYTEGSPQDFLLLAFEKRGDLHLIETKDLLENVLGGVGLYAGLQNSVIRRSFFQDRRFVTEFYNEAEDQAVIPRAIYAGMRFAYFDNVHVEYRVHDSNSSGSATVMNFPKKEKLIKGLIEGFENLPKQIEIGEPGMRRLRERLADLYMWQLGYSVYWKWGKARLSRSAYWRAIKLNPSRLEYWKTLLVSYLKKPSWTD
jgi:glycosyltransferase involved in cell wall biosynthesis